MRILGIDPGSSATGWGVVERRGSRVVHVAHGTIRPKGASLAARLASLHAALAALMAEQAPASVAIERIFVAASPRAALVLGQARGVALAALAGGGLGVSEYAPSEIKLAVTGTGAAEKSQVQAMVAKLLALAAPPPRDASDALAVALCHAHAGPLAALLDGRGTRRGARRASRPAERAPSGAAPGRLVWRRVR